MCELDNFSSPAAGNDHWLSSGRGESNAADPFGVAFLGRASSDGELAVAKSIPQLDSL